jgi:hypothetical protein
MDGDIEGEDEVVDADEDDTEPVNTSTTITKKRPKKAGTKKAGGRKKSASTTAKTGGKRKAAPAGDENDGQIDTGNVSGEEQGQRFKPATKRRKTKGNVDDTGDNSNSKSANPLGDNALNSPEIRRSARLGRAL